MCKITWENTEQWRRGREREREERERERERERKLPIQRGKSFRDPTV